MLGVEHTRDIVISASHKNVIHLNAPHRYDLISELCINNEVKVFNNKLRRKLERFKNVQLIEVPSERELYTNHGQHLNWRGKETMANKIALSIEKVLKRKVDPINKEWQEKNKPDNQRYIECNPDKDEIDNQEHTEPIHEKSLSEYTTTLDKSDCPENKNSDDADIIQDKTPYTDSKEIIRSSIRSKKLPTSRYSDFLWEI